MVNTLTNIWNGMDGRRRGVLVGGIAAMIVIMVILTRLVTAPSYALLYSGLDAAASGDIIAAIEARGVAYQVRGDAIHVDLRERDALRMSLAGEGLPANGAAGYELLDTLSGFGTTSQMFDAAYWRAKEGELARTISSSTHIRAARVHLANPGSDPFQPAQDITASVALRPAAGGLGPGHAQALRYLVASSVPGLLPENVTIIDADSGQMLGSQTMMSPMADAAGRAEDLRRNIERLLAARVGPGNAVVQVSVELNNDRETILERTIDPESRVVVATDTEERDTSSRDSESGAVTVASNLPDGDAAGGSGEASSEAREARERVTFDMSEMQREIERGPGDVRRISVAVLLNGVVEVGADGVATTVARVAPEMEALQALVETAIGFNAERGDAVTIESMAFDERIQDELTPPGFADRVSLDLGRVLQTVVLAAAALFIAFGLLRPLLRREAVALPPGEPETDTASFKSLPPDMASGLPELPSIPMGGFPEIAGGTEGVGELGQLPALPDFSSDGSDASADPVVRLRRMIEEREEETVEILRSWMEDDDEVRT